MIRLLSILILVLSIVLFPPATLALVSNNAVPGDATYPIKIGLENVVFAIFSINPATRAWFAKARSDRRFKEFSVLIAHGKKAQDSLNDLVEQTNMAAEEIKKVDDPLKRGELIAQLSESITKYDQKLTEVSESQQPKPAPLSSDLSPTPTQTPTVTSISTPASSSLPTSTSSPRPGSSVAPTKQPESSQAVKPSEMPTPPPAQTPAPPTPVETPLDSSDVEEAKKKFEEIRKRLEDEKNKVQKEELKEDKIDRKGKVMEEKREDQEKRDDGKKDKREEFNSE